MTSENIRDSIEERMQFSKNMAVYESVPPMTHGAISALEDAVAEFENYLDDLVNRPIQRSQLVNQAQEILAGDRSGNDFGRIVTWPDLPVPWPPLPWPPIILMGSKIIEGDEVDQIPDTLAARFYGDERTEQTKEDGVRAARIFPAIIAGLALGSALGTIAAHLRRSDGGDAGHENPAFAMDYIKSIGLDVAQAATMTRPDYVRANEVFAPSIDAQLNTPEIAEKFEALVSEMAGSNDRALVTGAVFLGCVAIGFAAGYLSQRQ